MKYLTVNDEHALALMSASHCDLQSPWQTGGNYAPDLNCRKQSTSVSGSSDLIQNHCLSPMHTDLPCSHHRNRALPASLTFLLFSLMS